MPQLMFSPIDFYFRWTEDWYEWDRDSAINAARKARDVKAKELNRRGFLVQKFTFTNQTVTCGGIGSGLPEITHVVPVYGLSYHEPGEQT